MRPVLYAAVALVWLAAQASADCTCNTAKVKGGWCGDCKVGYVDGVKLKSRTLFEATEGKAVDPTALKCGECKEAVKTDGHCKECHVGYAGKRAFKSWVAHFLARGEPVDPEKVTCAACKKNTAGAGWCETCKAGAVGPAVFKDKKVYEEAAKAREVLLAAAEAKCEQCAVAMVTDGTCEACKIEYEHGKKKQADSE